MGPVLYSFTGGKQEQSGDLTVLKEDGPNADILAIGEKFGSLTTLIIKDGGYSHTFNYVGTNTNVYVEIGTCSSFQFYDANTAMKHIYTFLCLFLLRNFLQQ